MDEIQVVSVNCAADKHAGNAIDVDFSDGRRLQVVARFIWHAPQADIERILIRNGDTKIIFNVTFSPPHYTDGRIWKKTADITPQGVAAYFKIAQRYVREKYESHLDEKRVYVDDQSPYYIPYMVLCRYMGVSVQWLESQE